MPQSCGELLNSQLFNQFICWYEDAAAVVNYVHNSVQSNLLCGLAQPYLSLLSRKKYLTPLCSAISHGRVIPTVLCALWGGYVCNAVLSVCVDN